MDGNALRRELIVGSSESPVKPATLGAAVPSMKAVGTGADVDTLPEEGFVEIVGTALNTGSDVKLPAGVVIVGFRDTLGW